MNAPTASDVADPAKDSDGTLFFQLKVTNGDNAAWYPVQLLGICQDSIAGEDGAKAGLTFGFKNGYESRAMHSAANGTNWQDCDLRVYLNGDFLGTLSFGRPDGSSYLEDVVKVTQLHAKAEVGETVDKVFVPSVFETYGATEAALNPEEGTWPDRFQYEWFAKGGTGTYAGNAYIAKKLNGVAAWWWLRSPRRDGIQQFRYHAVGPGCHPESNYGLYNGTGIMLANASFAIVPCFAL